MLGVLGAVVFGSQAMALPVSSGLNTLVGQAWGLDENYIGSSYVMPNGVVGTASGTQGMTESLTLAGGINLPQPALLPATDPRSAVANPMLALTPYAGQARWGARTGAVIGWSSINFQNLLSGNAALPFVNTGVAYNLTPQQFVAVNNAPTDAGGAPGSVAADGVPDRLAFTTLVNGRRSASITLTFFGTEDGSLFGGTTPSALVPRVDLYEGGAWASFGPIPPGTALMESDFDHNTGALGGSLAAFDDGALLLSGSLSDAFATLTWTETGVGSNAFVLDISFEATVTYDNGSLLGQLINPADPSQTVSANWNNIPFPVSTSATGLDFNGNDVFDFRGGAQGIGGSFSADQSFLAGIPEPVTGSMAVMSVLGLLAYASRRRTA